VFLALDFAEVEGEVEADGECAGDDGEKLGVEIHHNGITREEDEADEEVEEAPEKIDHGSGVTFAGRFGEGAGKKFAAQAGREVGDAVAEKGPGEEERDVVHSHTVVAESENAPEGFEAHRSAWLLSAKAELS
jgi:hypothetical protein